MRKLCPRCHHELMGDTCSTCAAAKDLWSSINGVKKQHIETVANCTVELNHSRFNVIVNLPEGCKLRQIRLIGVPREMMRQEMIELRLSAQTTYER